MIFRGSLASTRLITGTLCFVLLPVDRKREKGEGERGRRKEREQEEGASLNKYLNWRGFETQGFTASLRMKLEFGEVLHHLNASHFRHILLIERGRGGGRRGEERETEERR